MDSAVVAIFLISVSVLAMRNKKKREAKLNKQ